MESFWILWKYCKEVSLHMCLGRHASGLMKKRRGDKEFAAESCLPLSLISVKVLNMWSKQDKTKVTVIIFTIFFCLYVPISDTYWISSRQGHLFTLYLHFLYKSCVPKVIFLSLSSMPLPLMTDAHGFYIDSLDDTLPYWYIFRLWKLH